MSGFNHKAPGGGSRRVPERQIVKSDSKIGGFPLPEGVLSHDEQWHPATLRWWDSWRRSPQGVRMMTEPDWDYLLDTALLHHQMWQSGGKNSERAAEIRMRVSEFGATPAARARLRMEIEIPEEYPVGNRGRSHQIDPERRARLTAMPRLNDSTPPF